MDNWKKNAQAACTGTCSINMNMHNDEHAAGTCSMDMDMKHRYGDAAWTIGHGWTHSMYWDMQLGQECAA
jgi:hypothetical protein